MFVKLVKALMFFAACICCFNIAKAQNFTTKGVEFWAAYGAHAGMYKNDGGIALNGGSQKMIFYFLCNKTTTVTVEIPAIGWTKQYKVTAGKTIESDEIPKAGTQDMRLLEEGISNKGIHITSDELITAYCHIYDDNASATTLLIPVNIAGQEYYTLGYTQQSLNPNARSYCFVIATDENTEIEVTPAANTLNHPAGVPFFQKLKKGEVLTLFGAGTGKEGNIYKGTDLSGTYIRTIIQQENDICKKVVVFSGSSATSIVCDKDTNYTSDNIFEQVPSIDNWGSSFIAVPTLNMRNNRYRAIVLDSSQKVYLNGRLLNNIINNRYYEFSSNQPVTIRSDSLIAVAQYITSAGQCDNEAIGDKGGDPEMIYLSPMGSGITSTIINSTKHEGIEAHFINVVMKAIDVDSFKLDGQTMPQEFKVYDRKPTYAIAQIQVSPGRHVLECDSGFSTYAYGYGKLESYGYNGGFSTKFLAGYLGVRNPYNAVASSTTTCTATPFRLYFDIEVKLLSLNYTFDNNSNLQPHKDGWLKEMPPDSSYFVDSIKTTFYRYYLPETYQYNVVEQLPVQLTAYYPDKKGCIVKKRFFFLIDVIQKPVANLITQYDNCINSVLSFTDNSRSFGNSALVKWQWDFNDGNTSSERNPKHQYNDYGEYNMQMRIINDVGCYADKIQPIGMYHRPSSSFIMEGVNCNKQDISFKSTATVENDELTEWQWSLSDNSTFVSSSFIKQFADSGSYEIKLVSKSKHGCADTATQVVQIYQTPDIKIPPILYVPAGDTMRLKPTYSGNIKSYAWAPSTFLSSAVMPEPIASANVDITYNITAIAADASCKAIATTTIKVQKKLNIPSAFTPNGDGLNDTWRIFNIEDYTDCTIQVFNRWGNRVFSAIGYYTPWKGTFNNQPLPAGTYLYVIVTHTKRGNMVQSGNVTIIR